VASIDKGALATFEMVSKRRNGIAVAEARDGICTICHVRLRPQVFNTVRRNDSNMQNLAWLSAARAAHGAAANTMNAATIKDFRMDMGNSW